MNKGLETLQKIHKEIYLILPELLHSIVDLTLNVEQKSINSINKQFQDLIMNYFFEDFIGEIIKHKFQVQSKSQIKDQFMSEISKNVKRKKNAACDSKSKNKKKNTIKKFMLLPQKYIEEIIQQNKQKEYISLLSEMALDKIIYKYGEQRWRSQIRKKTFSVILLVHYYNNYPIQSVFEMWDNTFPSLKIKQKKNQLKQIQKHDIQQEKQRLLDQTQAKNNKNQMNLNNNHNTMQNQISKRLLTKRKCECIEIYEPQLSKQKQLENYLCNFKDEYRDQRHETKISSYIETEFIPSNEVTSFQEQITKKVSSMSDLETDNQHFKEYKELDEKYEFIFPNDDMKFSDTNFLSTQEYIQSLSLCNQICSTSQFQSQDISPFLFNEFSFNQEDQITQQQNHITMFYQKECMDN